MSDVYASHSVDKKWWVDGREGWGVDRKILEILFRRFRWKIHIFSVSITAQLFYNHYILIRPLPKKKSQHVSALLVCFFFLSKMFENFLKNFPTSFFFRNYEIFLELLIFTTYSKQNCWNSSVEELEKYIRYPGNPERRNPDAISRIEGIPVLAGISIIVYWKNSLLESLKEYREESMKESQ